MAICALSLAKTPTRPPTGPLTDTSNPTVRALTFRVAAPSVDAPQQRSFSNANANANANAIVSVNAKAAFGNGVSITTSHGAAALVVNANTLALGTT